MRNRMLLVIASAVFSAVGLNAQQPQQPSYYQTVACVKITPGKFAEFRQFVNEASKKMAETRAKAGEISSWAVLRSVMPAGTEARCDYAISTIYEGAPPAPQTTEGLGKALEKAGVKMTAAQYLAKRDSLSHLVAMEMWRPRIRLGQPEKGHYLLVNYMKVHDATAYYKFERETWQPLADAMIKEGTQSGWMLSTVLLPGGTDVKYTARTVDVYPSWDAVFKGNNMQEVFKKVFPDKDYQQTFESLTKLRDLAERDLFVFEELVRGKKEPAATTDN